MPADVGPADANPYIEGRQAPAQPNPYATSTPTATPPANPYTNPYAAGDAAPGPVGYLGYGEGALSCRFCGSVPAVQATIRGHQGFLVIMRFLKLEGPFCRDCGIATHRRMTADSLWQGWWGIASSVINPITMLANLPQRVKINKLTPPMPGAPGRPMNPGRPLVQRAAILGLLLPVLVIGALVYGAKSDPTFASVGD